MNNVISVSGGNDSKGLDYAVPVLTPIKLNKHSKQQEHKK